MSLQRRRAAAVEAAVQRLARDVSSDILFVPIEIVDNSYGFPIACIDQYGIKLTEYCVDNDPKNLEVYIAHEIFHEVVDYECSKLLFPAPLYNMGCDYKINQLIEQFFGYNVLRVKFRGLRDPRFDNLSIEGICNLLPSKPYAHFGSVLRHPMIIQIANELRTRFNLKNHNPDIIDFDFSDSYYHTLRRHYTDLTFQNLPDVNPDFVVKHLWLRHFQYAHVWKQSSLGKVLTHSQTLALVPNTSTLDTEGNAELSMFAAMYIIKALDTEYTILQREHLKLSSRRTRVRAAIRNIEEKLTKGSVQKRSLKQKLTLLTEREARYSVRIRMLSDRPRLRDLLKKAPSVQVRKCFTSRHCLSSALTTAYDTPKYSTLHPTVKAIQYILKLAYMNLADIEDVYNNFKKQTEHITEAPELDDPESDFSSDSEADSEADLDDYLAKVQRKNSQPNPVQDAEDNSGEGSSTDSNSSFAGEDDGSGDGKPNSDGEDDGSKARPVTGTSPQETSQDGKVGLASGAGPQETSQAGKGVSNRSYILETLDVVALNPKIFKSILRHSVEFGEKLIARPSYKANPQGLYDRTFTVGSDLDRVLSSEIGRLSNEFTKLSFLVDLANGNLLQNADLEPRRGPLILMLDCSGSMHGRYYEIAAGFCLAMINKLQDSKRSVMLIKFSSTTDHVLVWEANCKSPSMLDLAKALVTPSFGGTSFDTVLQECFSQIEKRKWQQPQGLLISDGADTVSDSIIARCPADLKLTALLTTSKTVLRPFSEVVHVRRTHLALELTKVGNSML